MWPPSPHPQALWGRSMPTWTGQEVPSSRAWPWALPQPVCSHRQDAKQPAGRPPVGSRRPGGVPEPLPSPGSPLRAQAGKSRLWRGAQSAALHQTLLGTPVPDTPPPAPARPPCPRGPRARARLPPPGRPRGLRGWTRRCGAAKASRPRPCAPLGSGYRRRPTQPAGLLSVPALGPRAPRPPRRTPTSQPRSSSPRARVLPRTLRPAGRALRLLPTVRPPSSPLRPYLAVCALGSRQRRCQAGGSVGTWRGPRKSGRSPRDVSTEGPGPRRDPVESVTRRLAVGATPPPAAMGASRAGHQWAECWQESPVLRHGL